MLKSINLTFAQSEYNILLKGKKRLSERTGKKLTWKDCYLMWAESQK